jgi:non-specific protein-tyrosine kinase
MSDPGAVRLIETMPQPASGPVLQQAILASGHFVSEEFRFLASKVASLAASRFTTIGIVSAGPGEGKTTVSLGLAAALARASSHRVLLLEADLRQPSIEKYLGLPRTNGVAEWLGGSTDPIPVRRISPAGFSVISSGRGRLAEPEKLASDRMSALIGACQLSFGFVVVDCPPLSPVADPVAMQDLLDGFLLVVRARNAPREMIQRAANRLKDGRIQGVVFVDQPEVLPSGYSYGYRRYGGARAN